MFDPLSRYLEIEQPVKRTTQRLIELKTSRQEHLLTFLVSMWRPFKQHFAVIITEL